VQRLSSKTLNRLNQQIVELSNRHLVRRPGDDDARMTAEREKQQVAELKIGCNENRIHRLSTRENLGILVAGEPNVTNVSRPVPGLAQNARSRSRHVLVNEEFRHSGDPANLLTFEHGRSVAQGSQDVLAS
jgi:hypothetical protein